MTVKECERLQTLPDDYTNVDGVSKVKRYEAIGNGWTVDVIAYILKNIADNSWYFISLWYNIFKEGD